MSATVTLHRQAVVDLLAGSYAACNLLEDDAGISADELRLRLDDVTFEVLGSLEDDVVAPLWARADAIAETVHAS
jgi:hypothetical protein